MPRRKNSSSKRFNQSYKSLGSTREINGVIIEMPPAGIRDTSDIEQIIDAYVARGLKAWDDKIDSKWEPPDQDRLPQPGEIRARNGRVVLPKQK